jgi:hypothetical protein
MTTSDAAVESHCLCISETSDELLRIASPHMPRVVCSGLPTRLLVIVFWSAHHYRCPVSLLSIQHTTSLSRSACCGRACVRAGDGSGPRSRPQQMHFRPVDMLNAAPRQRVVPMCVSRSQVTKAVRWLTGPARSTTAGNLVSHRSYGSSIPRRYVTRTRSSFCGRQAPMLTSFRHVEVLTDRQAATQSMCFFRSRSEQEKSFRELFDYPGCIGT